MTYVYLPTHAVGSDGPTCDDVPVTLVRFGDVNGIHELCPACGSEVWLEGRDKYKDHTEPCPLRESVNWTPQDFPRTWCRCPGTPDGPVVS